MEYVEIPRGHLSTIILSTLLDGDKYGYEIIKAIEDKTDGRLSIKQASLYSNLKRMEDQQLISSYWLDSEIGGKRHYYRLTDIGRKQTDEWQKDLLENQDTIKSVIDGEYVAEKVEISPNKKSTILEQTNLFDLASKEEKLSEIKDDARFLPKNESFYSGQIDMFNNATSEDTYSPIDENNSKEDTFNYQEKDSIIDNVEINETYDIKDELNLYVKEKKSFVDSIKDVDESYSSKINFSGNSLNINTFERDIEQDFTPTQTVIEETIEDLNIVKEEIVEDSKKEEIKDDAVFITETTDISMLPKVKKIEPSIYENLTSNSELADKLFDKYYPDYEIKFKKNNEKADQPPESDNQIQAEQQYYYPKEKVSTSSNDSQKSRLQYDTNFTEIKNIYITRNDSNIKNHNKSTQTPSKKNIENKLSENYKNLISSSIISLLVILTSLIIYLSTRTLEVSARFLFVLLPIICLIPTILNLITLHKIIKIKKFTIKQYRNYQIYAILTVVILFAINMLFGLNFSNFALYSTTFLLLGISIAVQPIYILIKLLINKYTK